MLEKNRKKGQKRAKNLTKEKTLDLFDEFRKIHTLPQKKFKKFKWKLNTWKKNNYVKIYYSKKKTLN